MPSPFAPPGTPPRYLPDRPAAVEHIRLDVALDFATKSIRGTATLTLRARKDGFLALNLNAVDMELQSVLVGGTVVLVHDYDGHTLRIPLPEPVARGDVFEVQVKYAATPNKGLYFFGPDVTDPNRPTQCWTQGQDEDARHFFPCVDAPVEKSTTELICLAPQGKMVLSNGDLLERVDVGKNQTRWHYKLASPQASYLVTIVCGDFAEATEQAPESKVALHYWATPDRMQDARRTLEKTPRMMDAFARVIGIPYPHKRYSQVFVADFIFGGMENTSATTLTDQSLVDAEAALDTDMEYLVAHELAHQWWGNLVTCREWAEGWLNEGFATYFEYVWSEQEHGRDEADVHALHQLDGYLSDSETYQRPIVCRHYHAPIEIFDSHLYEKGGRVLHMLRHLVGDAAFFEAIRVYGNRFAGGSVETRDLVRTFESVTGRSLDRFFDQWVYQPGHAELDVTWNWDDERNVGQLRITQTQAADGNSEHGLEFVVPLVFEVQGELMHERVTVTQRKHVVEMKLAKKPTMVVFDSGATLLVRVKLDLPLPMLCRQLVAGPRAVDRIAAARALGQKPEPTSVKALASSLAADGFWAVRAEAATQLGELAPRPDALTALLAARNVAHPKARRAVAASLGKFKHSKLAADALVAWIQKGDASVFAVANAARSLGQTRDPRAAQVIPTLFGRKAFQDVVKARAVEGLGASTLHEALEPLIAAYTPQASVQTRRTALRALAQLAEGTPDQRRAREHIEQGLSDRDFTVRTAAAMALCTLNDAKAVPALEAASRGELDGRALRFMTIALRQLREGTRATEAVTRLSSEVEKLRDQMQALKERVDRIETPPTAPKPPSSVPPRPARRPRPAARRSAKSAGKPRR